MSAAFNSDVTVEVAVMFDADNPRDSGGTWTDITSDTRDILITRGRRGPHEPVAAGTCTLLLDNSSGDYTPLNASGTYYPNVRPLLPVRVRANYSSTWYTLFLGTTGAWRLSFPQHKDSVVRLECDDYIKLLNLARVSGSFVEDSAADRVDDVLDAADSGWSGRSETSVFDVQAVTVEDVPALTLIQQAAEAEGTLFYAARDGDMVFENRTFRDGVSTTATISDSGSNLRMVGVEYTHDDKNVWNQVVVAPLVQDGDVYGTSTYEDGGVTVGAAGSQEIYGIRTLARTGTLHVSKADAFQVASDLVGQFNQPTLDIQKLTVSPTRSEDATSGAWADLLALELSDRFTVSMTDPITVSADIFVEQITHRINLDGTWLIDIGASAHPDLTYPESTLYPTSTLYPN